MEIVVMARLLAWGAGGGEDGPVEDPATAHPIGVSCSSPVWVNGP